MSFFKRLFGKKKEEKSTNNEQKKPLENITSDTTIYTNFDKLDLPVFDINLIGNLPADTIALAAKLEKVVAPQEPSFELGGLYYKKLLAEGILNIPIVFRWKDQGYAVFLVYNEEQAKLLNTAKVVLSDSDYPQVLYVSTLDCRAIIAPASQPLQFALSDMECQADAKPRGEYAMWWSMPEDTLFHQSPDNPQLERIMALVQDYGTYLFGHLLCEIKMPGFEKLQRVGLPDQEANFVLMAPESQLVVLSVSKEKGIRFQFSQEKTSANYRHFFLQHIAGYFDAYRLFLEEQKAPKDTPSDESCYDWYKMLQSVVAQKEQKNGADSSLVIGAMGFG